MASFAAEPPVHVVLGVGIIVTLAAARAFMV